MTKPMKSTSKLQKSNSDDEFLNEKADLLRIAGHPIRLQIISLLLEESQEYHTIFSAVNTSKGALVNHFKILLDQGLISRLQRGRYQITTDGITLYYTLNSIFEKSRIRTKKFKENIRKEYAGLEDYYHKTLNKVKNEPIYQDSWNTFIASTTGVLKSLEVDCDVNEVGGYSGISFIVTSAIGEICSSSNRVYSLNAWKEIINGINTFGWKCHRLQEDKHLTIGLNTLYEDEDRANKIFDSVKNIIDKHCTPVILFGIPTPGFGIVKGYMGDYYSVSTFRSGSHKIEPPIRFNEIYWSGSIDMFYFKDKVVIKDKEIRDEEAIIRIYNFAKGTDIAIKDKYITANGYVSGPKAYQEWANALESSKFDEISLYSNSFLANYYQDLKKSAAIFLGRMALKYNNFPQSAPLRKAAKEYRECEKLFQEFNLIFPYLKWKNIKMTNENRKKGANILINIKNHEEFAVDYLYEAKKKWITSKLFSRQQSIIQKKKVFHNALYPQGCWNSFISSITGVLKSYGIKDDIVEIAGRSGYIFLTNVSQKNIRESSLRKIPIQGWDLIMQGIESFGWKVHQGIEYIPSENKQEYSHHIFEQIKRLIIDHEIPIVLWGLPTTSYGIVLGFDKRSYIVSTYRKNDYKEDNPIRFDKITFDYWAKKESNFTDYYYLEGELKKKQKKIIDKESIERAIKIAKGFKNPESIYDDEYIIGPNAFDTWIQSLISAKNEPNIIFSNSYLAEVYHNARELVSRYLERMGERYAKFNQSSHLKQAAKEYTEVQYFFRKYCSIFPFFNQYEAVFNKKKRNQGIDILKSAKLHEIAAIKHLEQALINWE